MIVEPVPTGSPSRLRRTLARVAVLVPLVLLAAVIGVAIIGQATPPTLPAVAGVQPIPSETSQPSAIVVAPHGDPNFPDRPRRPPFPVAIDGLAVETVTSALADRAADRTGDVVAIEGYLGIIPLPTNCGDGFDPLGPLCERDAILAEIPWVMGGGGFADLGPHVHARTPVGIHLPAAIAGMTVGARGSPIPAVIVGRFDRSFPAGCGSVKLGCEIGFDLDGVVWADGSPYRAEPFIGPAIDAIARDWVLSNRQAVEALAVGPSGVVLESALVRPATLRAMNPKAFRIVRRDPPNGLVWYVRGLTARVTPKQPQAPQLVWAVVDDVSLRVLARGVGGVSAGAQAR